jgi:predicted dehydrogenase
VIRELGGVTVHERPLRIGVLGTAQITAEALIRPAHAAGVELVAVASRDAQRGAAFAAEHGIATVLDSYSDLVRHPDIDAVYNPLPNSLHGPWNRRAIQSGKHVLSEKPFASNSGEARAVAEMGKAAGLVVADGFHYAYHPVTKRLETLVSSGDLGELERIEVVMTGPAPPSDNLRWSLQLSGGALMDLGCYGLHFHRLVGGWLGEEPRITRAVGGQRAGSPGVDEWVDVELVYPSGLSGGLHCDMAARALQFSCTVSGTRGTLTASNFVLPHLDDTVTFRTETGTVVNHLGLRSSYSYQLEAFLRAVRLGEPMPTGGDDPVKTMRLIDDAYEALGMRPRPSAEDMASGTAPPT